MLTLEDHIYYNNYAEWSSLVARQAHNLKVIGSNPVSAIFSGIPIFAFKVAQNKYSSLEAQVRVISDDIIVMI